MKRALRKLTDDGCYYFDADGIRHEGKHKHLRGDATGIVGDATGIVGDATGIVGDLDECELTDDDRARGVDIDSLIADAREWSSWLLQMEGDVRRIRWPERSRMRSDGWLLHEWPLPDRLRILPFAMTLLVNMLIQPARDYVTDAPADLRIVGVRMLSCCLLAGGVGALSLEFLACSDSFEAVTAGEEIPRGEVWFTTRGEDGEADDE